MQYEMDRTPDNKKAARNDEKEYNKAIRKNTTYRKGQIKKEVNSDLSRKYLSEAKKVKKELDKSPYDMDLQKRYSYLMSKHDIERAKARRAPVVYENRSKKKASIKRATTIALKGAAYTAALGIGITAVNKYGNLNLNFENVDDVIRMGKRLVSYL